MILKFSIIVLPLSDAQFVGFGRELYEEHSCEIILNLEPWFRKSL